MLEFGNGQGLNAKSFGFDSRARLRKRCGEYDGLAYGQGISGVRFRGIHIHPVKALESVWMKPRAVTEERISSKISDGGFQVQAARHRHGRQIESVLLRDYSQLSYALGV